MKKNLIFPFEIINFDIQLEKRYLHIQLRRNSDTRTVSHRGIEKIFWL